MKEDVVNLRTLRKLITRVTPERSEGPRKDLDAKAFNGNIYGRLPRLALGMTGVVKATGAAD